jgi:hypothetical protein
MGLVDSIAIRVTERLVKKINRMKKKGGTLNEIYSSVNNKRYEEIIFNPKVPREYEYMNDMIVIAIPVFRHGGLSIGIYTVNDTNFKEYKVV